jgi:hypothetical protein
MAVVALQHADFVEVPHWILGHDICQPVQYFAGLWPSSAGILAQLNIASAGSKREGTTGKVPNAYEIRWHIVKGQSKRFKPFTPSGPTNVRCDDKQAT